MRIAYDNQIDDLAASEITALTAESLYAATNVQDERLTVQWRTTAATDQTIIFNAGGTVTEGETWQPMFQATTNLLTDPENLTSANWTKTAVTASADSVVLGFQRNKITATSTSATCLVSQVLSFAATTNTVIFIVQRGSTTNPEIRITDNTVPATRARVQINFSTKAVTYSLGAIDAGVEDWIDDYTLRVAFRCDTIVPGNTNQIGLRVRDASGGVGEYTYYTAAMAVANAYPLAYTATSRAAWATSGTVAFRMPPSGKFIVDCEVKPYFAYDTAAAKDIANWYIDATHELRLVYSNTTDSIEVIWYDGGTSRKLQSDIFDAGTALTINQNIRIVGSFDLATGAVTSGSRLLILPRDQGSLYEDDTWSGAIDALTSTTYSTLRLGNRSGSTQLDGLMRYFRVYGGTLEDTITTEEDIDLELEEKQLLYSRDYASHFDLNTFAIMGHNISAGASVKVEANDWDEWNYTDGSGSSIIQQTLTWDEDTIMYFFPSIYKREYIKLTVNDPNNDDGYLAIGRIWAGKYLTIDPSSTLDFRVVKKRSDRSIYNRNRQKWSDQGYGWRRFEMNFPRTATTMLDRIQRMYDSVGTYSSIIFCNFDSIRDYEIVEPVYCSIVGDIEFQHAGRMKFTYELVMEEDR